MPLSVAEMHRQSDAALAAEEDPDREPDSSPRVTRFLVVSGPE
jgi:hypothetical protein